MALFLFEFSSAVAHGRQVMPKKIVNREYILMGISLLIVVALLFIGPIPQDKNDHNFADKRQLAGSGDLRPFAVVQYLPGVLILFILMVYDPAFTQKWPIVMGFVFYGLAKLVEILDSAVFD